MLIEWESVRGRAILNPKTFCCDDVVRLAPYIKGWTLGSIVLNIMGGWCAWLPT